MDVAQSPGADPKVRDALLLAAGFGGLAMCLTLVFLGMRSVMDIGGACASGGADVPAQSCPEGSAPALFLGILGGLGFGALGLVAGGRVGGVWPGVLLLVGWSGLFASLGWNFLEYGLLNPPEGQRLVWGWIIPGIVFEVMAIVPILLVASAARRGRGRARLRAAGREMTRVGSVRRPGFGAVTRAVPGAPTVTRDEGGTEGGATERDAS